MSGGRNPLMIAIAISLSILLLVSVPSLLSEKNDGAVPDMVPTDWIVSKDNTLSPPTGTTYSGNITLTGDYSFDDGSNVIIADGTVVDIGTFKLDLGRSSSVFINGGITLKMSAGGSLTIGKSTTVSGPHYTIPSNETGTIWSFDGDISLSETGVTAYTISVELLPAGSDHLTIYTEDGSRYVEFTHFRLERTISLDAYGSSQDADFSDIGPYLQSLPATASDHFVFDTHKVVSVSNSIDSYGSPQEIRYVATAEYETGHHALEFTVTSGKLSVDEFNFKSVCRTLTKPNIGLVESACFEDIGPVTAIVDDNGILSMSARIQTITLSKELDGDETRNCELRDNDVSAKFDVSKIYQLITSKDQELSKYLEAFENAEFTSAKVTLKNDETEWIYSNLRFTYDTDTLLGTRIVFCIYDEKNAVQLDVLLGGLNIESLRYTTDHILNAKISSTAATISTSGAEGTDLVTLTGMMLDITNMDLSELAKTQTRYGKINVQDIIDSCDSVELCADRIEKDEGDDGNIDIVSRDTYMLLCKARGGLNTLTLDVGSLKGTYSVGQDFTFDIGKTGIYLESDGSLSTVINALVKGATFTDNAHATLKITCESATVSAHVQNEKAVYDHTVVLKKNADLSARPALIQLDIDYLKVYERVRVCSNLNLLGYTLEMKSAATFTEPTGNGYLHLLMDDTVGTVTLTYSSMDSGFTDLQLDSSLTMSAKAEIDYYGIRIGIEMKSLKVTLEDSDMKISGYDYRESGLMAALSLPLKEDFTIAMNVSLRMDSLTVRCDSWDEDYKQYSNTVVDVSDLSGTVRHSKSIDLLLGRMRIVSDMTGHDSIDRTIEHLSINKVLEKVPEKKDTFDPKVVPLAATMAAVVAAFIIPVAVLMVYRRHEQ